MNRNPNRNKLPTLSSSTSGLICLLIVITVVLLPRNEFSSLLHEQSNSQDLQEMIYNSAQSRADSSFNRTMDQLMRYMSETTKTWAAVAERAAPRTAAASGDKGCSESNLHLYGPGVGEASNHLLTLAHGLAVADSLMSLIKTPGPRGEGVHYAPFSAGGSTGAAEGTAPNSRYTLLIPAYITRDLSPFSLEKLQQLYCVRFLHDSYADDEQTRVFLNKHKTRKDKMQIGNIDSPVSFETGSGLHSLHKSLWKSAEVMHAHISFEAKPAIKRGDVFISSKNLFYFGAKVDSSVETEMKAIQDLQSRRSLRDKANRKLYRTEVGHFVDDKRSPHFWDQKPSRTTQRVYERGSDFLFYAQDSRSIEHIRRISKGGLVDDGKADASRDRVETLRLLDKEFFARYYIGVISALWSTITFDYRLIASHLARTYFGGTFTYSSIHKRQFERTCDKLFAEKSDLHRDFAALDKYVHGDNKQDLPKDGGESHPICTMDPAWVRPLVLNETGSAIVYVASDGQSDDNTWNAISHTYVIDASGKRLYNALLGRKCVRNYVELGLLNSAVVDVYMSALGTGIHIGNPLSTFSLQVYILRLASVNKRIVPLGLDFDVYMNIHVEDSSGASSSSESQVNEQESAQPRTWVTRRTLNNVFAKNFQLLI